MKKLYFRAYIGFRSYQDIVIGNQVFKSFTSSNPPESNQALIEEFLKNIKIHDDITMYDESFLYVYGEYKDFKTFEKTLSFIEKSLFFWMNYENHSMISEDIITLEIDEERQVVYYNRDRARYSNDWSITVRPMQMSISNSDMMKNFFSTLSDKLIESENGSNGGMYNRQNLSMFIRSFEWYNRACEMIRNEDPSASIIFFATAFEAFLKLPYTNKGELFSYAIQRYLGDNNYISKWAKQFYQLRNEIVHGSQVEDDHLLATEYKHIEHWKVAKHIFEECMFRQLYLSEGFDYKRPNMDIRLKWIQDYLLLSNQEKLERLKLKINGIRSDKRKAQKFFDMLALINYQEARIDKKQIKKTEKLFKDFVKEITIYLNTWVEESLSDERVSKFIEPLNKMNKGIYPIDPREKLKGLLIIPSYGDIKDANTLYNVWHEIYDFFTKSKLFKLDYYQTSYKKKGMAHLIQFVYISSRNFG